VLGTDLLMEYIHSPLSIHHSPLLNMNPVLAYFQSQVGKSITQSPSALGNWLNGTIEEVTEGEITVAYTVRHDMTNAATTLHGGAASAIIDEVMGMAVYSLGKEFIYVTISLTVDFLDNAREGEKIWAKARVIRNGRTLINVECQLLNAEGKILAKGTSNLVVTQMKTGF
jgi:acyl-coenzyme A thioesterase 13